MRQNHIPIALQSLHHLLHTVFSELSLTAILMKTTLFVLLFIILIDFLLKKFDAFKAAINR